MGAELRRDRLDFPYDNAMDKYLRATERSALADLAKAHTALLEADADVEKNPSKYFDQVIEIDLSKLEPQVVGPHTPDLARPVSQLGSDVKKNGWPAQLKATLIGSCTNSSYEDISRAADLARQATKQGLKVVVPLLVTPGSGPGVPNDQARRTNGSARGDWRDGPRKTRAARASANGSATNIQPGEKNSIVSSFNRNFPARNDGNAETLSFLTSPEIVVGMAFAGTLGFKPDDRQFAGEEREARSAAARLGAPGERLRHFARRLPRAPGRRHRRESRSGADEQAAPALETLRKMERPRTNEKLPLLLKAKGKCTTDHISPAGPWLRFRGHLDNISDNMFTRRESTRSPARRARV
jgi:aconitate hydratase